MWELDHKEVWAPKNWCVWTVVLEKTLENFLGYKEIKPVNLILTEINPEYSLDGLMLKLRLQYFDHLMWGADSLEKTLMQGKIEGRKRKAWQRIRWLVDITDSMNMRKLWDMVKDMEASCPAVNGAAKSWTRLSNGTRTRHNVSLGHKLS